TAQSIGRGKDNPIVTFREAGLGESPLERFPEYPFFHHIVFKTREGLRELTTDERQGVLQADVSEAGFLKFDSGQQVIRLIPPDPRVADYAFTLEPLTPEMT